jgi:hypothetical protein
MVKTNHDIARLVQFASNFLVHPNLVGSIVRRPVDIDRRAKFAVEEVRPRRTRLDQVLAVAGWPQGKSLEVVQPFLFQFAVTFLAKRQKPLIPRPYSACWPSLSTRQLGEEIPYQESVED